jgi:hypothetical protein
MSAPTDPTTTAAPRTVPQPRTSAETARTEIRPFEVHVPEEQLADLRRRIAATRWPSRELVADRSQGVQLAALQQLARYWSTDYDWRRCEAGLNALPQFTTEIDGVDVHFIHVRSRHEDALPLIMTHGWPGSVVELLDTVGPLTDPTAHGGTAEDAFVRDASGRVVHGVAWPGEAVFPDFTDARVREWWGGLHAERLAQGFSGLWHDMNEPTSFTAFGEKTLPRSARHSLEGRGGDHQEAHNVYGLCMARAGYEGLLELAPHERPFLFSRSGWAGLQRYGGTWSGDVATGWPGCGLHCRWSWGWGCAGCRTRGRMWAASTGVRRRSCICGGSSSARTCRCSVRTPVCGRGAGSPGSSVRRCWSTRAWRSRNAGGCCRTS